MSKMLSTERQQKHYTTAATVSKLLSIAMFYFKHEYSKRDLVASNVKLFVNLKILRDTSRKISQCKVDINHNDVYTNEKRIADPELNRDRGAPRGGVLEVEPLPFGSKNNVTYS